MNEHKYFGNLKSPYSDKNAADSGIFKSDFTTANFPKLSKNDPVSSIISVKYETKTQQEFLSPINNCQMDLVSAAPTSRITTSVFSNLTNNCPVSSTISDKLETNIQKNCMSPIKNRQNEIVSPALTSCITPIKFVNIANNYPVLSNIPNKFETNIQKDFTPAIKNCQIDLPCSVRQSGNTIATCNLTIDYPVLSKSETNKQKSFTSSNKNSQIDLVSRATKTLINDCRDLDSKHFSIPPHSTAFHKNFSSTPIAPNGRPVPEICLASSRICPKKFAYNTEQDSKISSPSHDLPKIVQVDTLVPSYENDTTSIQYDPNMSGCFDATFSIEKTKNISSIKGTESIELTNKSVEINENQEQDINFNNKTLIIGNCSTISFNTTICGAVPEPLPVVNKCLTKIGNDSTATTMCSGAETTVSEYQPGSLLSNSNNTSLETSKEPLKAIENPININNLLMQNPNIKSKQHFCIFCSKLQSKLARHFFLKHKTEKRVKQAMAMPKKSLQRLKLLEELRKEGDYAHNTRSSKNSGI